MLYYFPPIMWLVMELKILPVWLSGFIITVFFLKLIISIVNDLIRINSRPT